MKNSGDLPKVRLWFGHITWVHIHATFEDLLNTSAVINKTHFEQRGMLHQDYQPFWAKNYQDTWAIGIHYTKRS